MLIHLESSLTILEGKDSFKSAKKLACFEYSDPLCTMNWGVLKSYLKKLKGIALVNKSVKLSKHQALVWTSCAVCLCPSWLSLEKPT